MTIANVDESEALVSNRLLFRITMTIGLLAALAAALTLAGRWIGRDMALGGNTESTTIRQIVVGQDRLVLPDNMIRFDTQRLDGRAEQVSIYLSWPDLEGYSRRNASLFSDPGRSDTLIFADFSQSVMSRDMSGRLAPIYARLFIDAPVEGPAGLTLHRLNRKSGFGDERLLTGRFPNGEDYVVRCLLPADPAMASSADCLRDVKVGKDLTMLYRFSSTLLPQWQEIDRAMRRFALDHIAG
jgi:hypothetical protein